MSDLTRTSIETNDLNREPTAEELANVPEITSQAELTDLMRSDEYKNSKLVQKLVAASLAKSNHSAPEEPQQSSDEVLAKQAAITRMMRDPRYKSDALYRFEVQEKIKALTANDNHDANTGRPITAADLKTPGQTIRVTASSSPLHGVAMTVQKVGRVEMPPSYTGLEIPSKKAKPEPFPGV